LGRPPAVGIGDARIADTLGRRRRERGDLRAPMQDVIRTSTVTELGWKAQRLLGRPPGGLPSDITDGSRADNIWGYQASLQELGRITTLLCSAMPGAMAPRRDQLNGKTEFPARTCLAPSTPSRPARPFLEASGRDDTAMACVHYHSLGSRLPLPDNTSSYGPIKDPGPHGPRASARQYAGPR